MVLSGKESQARYRLGLRARERLRAGSFPGTEMEIEGYRLAYDPGPELPGVPGRHSRWAITAVPVTVGESGVRGFCVDGDGRSTVTLDGTARAAKGHCIDESQDGLW